MNVNKDPVARSQFKLGRNTFVPLAGNDLNRKLVLAEYES
jgi:hypothetical protein